MSRLPIPQGYNKGRLIFAKSKEISTDLKRVMTSKLFDFMEPINLNYFLSFVGLNNIIKLKTRGLKVREAIQILNPENRL